MGGLQPASLRRLIAVAILALPASDQTAWVESLGVGPVVDALALELGDGARLADQFVAKGWLGSEALPPLQALDALLEDMSGPNNAHAHRRRTPLCRTQLAGAGGHVDGRAEAADVARKISMCQVAEYGYFWAWPRPTSRVRAFARSSTRRA